MFMGKKGREVWKRFHVGMRQRRSVEFVEIHARPRNTQMSMVTPL
jgi:hypothetical protein